MVERVSDARLSSLASAATSQPLVAANPDRRGLIVVNTDANDLFLKYGATASTADFSVKVAAGGSWTMPAPVFTGRIDAIWAGDGAGAAVATEL